MARQQIGGPRRHVILSQPQDKLTAGKTRHPTLHTRQDGLSAAKPMLNGPTDR